MTRTGAVLAAWHATAASMVANKAMVILNIAASSWPIALRQVLMRSTAATNLVMRLSPSVVVKTVGGATDASFKLRLVYLLYICTISLSN